MLDALLAKAERRHKASQERAARSGAKQVDPLITFETAMICLQVHHAGLLQCTSMQRRLYCKHAGCGAGACCCRPACC